MAYGWRIRDASNVVKAESSEANVFNMRCFEYSLTDTTRINRDVNNETTLTTLNISGFTSTNTRIFLPYDRGYEDDGTGITGRVQLLANWTTSSNLRIYAFWVTPTVPIPASYTYGGAAAGCGGSGKMVVYNHSGSLNMKLAMIRIDNELTPGGFIDTGYTLY